MAASGRYRTMVDLQTSPVVPVRAATPFEMAEAG
jgi:hypothetical protein